MKALLENISGFNIPFRETAVIIFLIVNGWRDIRTREILLPFTLVFGIVCGGISFLTGHPLSEFLISSALSGVFAGLSILSHGRVGMGDCLVLLALGMALHPGELLAALSLGMFFTVIPAMVMLLILKKGRNAELPFIPFLLAGYIGGLCLW